MAEGSNPAPSTGESIANLFEPEDVGRLSVAGLQFHRRGVVEWAPPLRIYDGDSFDLDHEIAIDDLDHNPGVLRLDHVLVGRAAVAQVVAELDRGLCTDCSHGLR
jgi:hypothetical protein